MEDLDSLLELKDYKSIIKIFSRKKYRYKNIEQNIDRTSIQERNNWVKYIKDTCKIYKYYKHLLRKNNTGDILTYLGSISTYQTKQEVLLCLRALDLKLLVLKFGEENLQQLKNFVYIHSDLLTQCRREKVKFKECSIKLHILDNFNNIFPNYEFIGKEVVVDKIGKIDILAKDKESGREVIIEVKSNTQNPNKQLLAYAKGYDNPILVGITNMDKKYYLDNIKYIKISKFGYKKKER